MNNKEAKPQCRRFDEKHFPLKNCPAFMSYDITSFDDNFTSEVLSTLAVQYLTGVSKKKGIIGIFPLRKSMQPLCSN